MELETAIAAPPWPPALPMRESVSVTLPGLDEALWGTALQAARLRSGAALPRRRVPLCRFADGEGATCLGTGTAGDWVVDEESIEGRGGEPVRAIAVFHVEEGLIERVRFLSARGPNP